MKVWIVWEGNLLEDERIDRVFSSEHSARMRAEEIVEEHGLLRRKEYSDELYYDLVGGGWVSVKAQQVHP